MGNHQSSTDYKERLGRNKVVMDRLRKSLRESFRRRKDHTPECSKPHQWQADESAVRAGTCSFQVKYLGCVEVFESRGMQVCEEALKVLRNSRRRPIRGTLYVTGDGLRVVDDETKGLIVDQTIEKVSFCAPDRNHEKGFSYICRDGTTRRWMCHGFLAIKDSGERLSHAVGCAFAVCLEKKQKRDKESVMMNFDPKTSTFTRTGSFRQSTMTERIQDGGDIKTVEQVVNAGQDSSENKGFSFNEKGIPEPPPPPPLKAVHNPYAIERPHATPMLLQRQGSFRGFGALNQTSPFKRQLSLRINELPSTLDRQRAMSLESSDIFSCQNGLSVTPIPESSPVVEKDSLSAVCQQVSQGLSLLSGDDDDDAFIASNKLPSHTESFRQSNIGNPWSATRTAENWVSPGTDYQSANLPKSSSNPSDITLTKPPVVSPPAVPLSSLPVSHQQPIAPPRRSSPNFSHLRSQSVGSAEAFYLTAANKPGPITSQLQQQQQPQAPPPPIPPAPRNTYDWSSQQHSYQIGHGNAGWSNGGAYNQSLQHQQAQSHQNQVAAGPFSDPFDAEWAAPVAGATPRANTNPFVPHSVKTFEVQM